MYTLSDGEYLIKLARRTISTYIATKQVIFDNSNLRYTEKRGTFTTLQSAGTKELRGCMGFTLPTKSLNVAVSESALNAAFFDKRFPSLKSGELNKIILELSLINSLQPFNTKKIEYPDLIEVGKDGLYLRKDDISAVILPQIASEQKWNSEEFLCQLSYKAGLSPDAWLEKSTNVFKFQVEIFAETSPNGKVVQIS